MPIRRLANSNPTRYRALKAAKDRKDVTSPPDIPLTAATVSRLDLFFPQYKTKYLAVGSALTAQTELTNQVKTAKLTAAYFIADFIDALQNAIRRGTFAASVRALYSLPVSHPLRPEIITEQQVLDWGERVIDGENARVGAGGAPITFPSLPEVDAAVTNFKNLNLQQAAAKTVYDNAQEALDADNAEADKLILKIWNELEAAFDEGNKPSMRRKCREWGVVYIPTPDETPSPDEYSIIGRVTDSTTGAGLNDATVHVEQAALTFNSEPNGDYFIPVIPAGTYTVDVLKNGYTAQHITGVVVTTGAITTLNVQLVPATTGTLSGTITGPGGAEPATVSITGGATTGTAADGRYSIPNIPAGAIEVRAWLNSDPATVQMQSVTITAGATVTVDFEF